MDIRKAHASLGMRSYEEFLAQSDEDTYAEWVHGEILPMAPVSADHQDLAGFLIALLRAFVDRFGGRVLHEPYQMKPAEGLPGRAPDIMVVLPEHLDRITPTHLEGPADLVVEIVSPESRVRDRGEKFYEYEQGGVREYWLIDPIRRQAEFYSLEAEGVFHPIPVGEDGVFRSRILAGFWLRVEWLWRRPPLLEVLKSWGWIEAGA